MSEMSNLFEFKYVLNEKLLKVLIGKVDAQLFKAAQHNVQTYQLCSSQFQFQQQELAGIDACGTVCHYTLNRTFVDY